MARITIDTDDYAPLAALSTPSYCVGISDPSGPDDADEDDAWQFHLGQPVEILLTGESGYVESRSESLNSADRFLVHYEAAQGGSAEKWFFGTDLNPETIN